MRCPSCRGEVPDGARFCPECGQDLRLRGGDERRVVTVLFADLVGFTSLSEDRDPEQVKNIVDACFERLVSDVHAFGGRVDKIIGDAIVALFGAPVAHEDDAERAVRAALRMQWTIGQVAEELGVAVRLRIGVNTGEVLVGSLRAGGDYTAMGDVVNTASRLQTAARPSTVLVGPATHAATRRVVTYEAIGTVNARGREQSIPAWEALDVLAPPGYRPDRDTAPLIGRDSELAMLTSSLDGAVRHGRAALLLVLGEAGVGKSRLAEEVAARAAGDHHAFVLEGRCVPYGEANVWWPIADALRSGCGIRPGDPAERVIERATASVAAALGDADGRELHRVLQGLLHLMGYDSELRGIDPGRAREEATAAVVTYVEQWALKGPVALLLSDLHWADDLVLELVDTLLERLASRPFVVLATARPLLEQRWHPPHGRHNLVVLTLDPLTVESSAELLAALAGPGVDGDLATALLQRSGGNPFFLEELVTLVTEAGIVAGGPTGVASGAMVGELPETLRGLVAARLDALEIEERRVLEDCAVLGHRGEIRAIEVMSGEHLGIRDPRSLLDSLEAKELLVISGPPGRERWAFRSDLVREVAYGTLTRADRARAHQGIASWMEANEDLDADAVVDRIAHHYARAAELARELGPVTGLLDDLVERTLVWIERAARRADQADIPVVAERLYSDGLRLLGDAPGRRQRAFRRGRAQARAGLRELTAARADATTAVAEARQAGPGAIAEVAESLVVLADIEQKESCWEAAEAALAEAGRLFADLGDPRGEAEVLRLRGFGALLRHEYVVATEVLERAMARFEALGDRRGAAWALQNLAWCAFYSGRAAEAEVRLLQAAATFEEIGDRGGLRWARGLLAWARFQQGHVDEAGELAEAVLEGDRRGGDRWAIGMMLVLAGSVRLWTGRTNSAIERLEQARTLFDGIGDPFGRLQASAVLGRALVLSGRVEDGLAVVDGLSDLHEGTAAMPSGGDRERVMAVLAGVAATVQVGDVNRTEDLLADLPADTSLDPVGSEVLVGDTERAASLGLHRLQSGDVAGALALLDGVRRQLLPQVDPNLSAAVALTLVAAGRVEDALAEAALVETHERSTYLDRTTAGIARGLGLARRGDGAAAVAALDQARATADATEDVISQSLARLAEAVAASTLGQADEPSRRADAEARLGAIGLQDTGWRRAFSAALGVGATG